MEQLLQLHDLSFVPEGGEVVVGRPDTGSYAVFPADGAELLHRLAQGMTLDQASDWYQSRYGEPVDVAEFAATLAELGFVREPGTPAEPAATSARLRGLGRAVFSLPAWGCYGLIAVLWLLAAVSVPALRPHPSQMFFTGSLVVVQTVVLAGQLPLVFLHESFHILAGRRLGLPTRLGISNRYTYIVFETQLNGLMSVPRRARYLPFLAGMVCDAIVFCLLGIAADFTRLSNGAFTLPGRLCLALAFTVLLRMAWQFQLYLRTDLYYVFANAFNCYDLHTASTALLRNRIWRALGRPGRIADEEQWTGHDRRVGTFYGPFIILGILTAILISAFATLPIIWQYLTTIAHEIGTGRADAHFWDAIASLGFNIAQAIAIIILSRRKRRRLAGRAPRLMQEKVV